MPGVVTDRLQLLRNHPVARLSQDRRVVLVACCCGFKPGAIASALIKAPGTIQNDITFAYATILDAVGLERDVALLTWWVMEHRACCVTDAFSFVENSGRLSG